MLERPRLHALTGVRFLAALHVVLFHFREDYFGNSPDWLRAILANGDVGVELFFILSGFVLCYTYLRPGADVQQVDKKGFWVARFARIYPAYVLGLALAAPFFLVTLWRENSPALTALKATGATLLTLFMAQAWYPGTALIWNSPAWSLTCEAFFYFLFPFFVSRLGAVRTRALLLGLLVLWGAILLAPVLYIQVLAPRTSDASSASFLYNFVLYNPLFRLPEFLLGCVLGILFLRAGGSKGLIFRSTHPAVLPTLASVALVGLLILGENLPRPLISEGLAAPLFAALVFGLAVNQGPLALFLASRPLVLLGEASYSIYILQQPVWSIMAVLSERISGSAQHLREPVFFAVYIPVLVAVSLASLFLLEIPARTAIKRNLTLRLSPPPPVRDNGWLRANSP